MPWSLNGPSPWSPETGWAYANTKNTYAKTIFRRPSGETLFFTPSPELRSITFTPLSVRMLRFTSSLELRSRTFHTPLGQNATFHLKPWPEKHYFFTSLSVRKLPLYLKPRAPKHDFFTPLSVRMLLFTPSPEPRSITFSQPSQSECYFLHQASTSEAWRFHTPLGRYAHPIRYKSPKQI